MRKERAMYKVSFVFIAGFVAGAAIVLFATPKKLQKQIKEAVEDKVDNVEKYVKKVVNA
jgi:hypothetical protein